MGRFTDGPPPKRKTAAGISLEIAKPSSDLKRRVTCWSAISGVIE
jgi:hypothetical protein